MQNFKLKDFIGGWFCGNFFPSIYNTKDFEVSIKYYRANDCDAKHRHNIINEITVVVNGTVSINGEQYTQGDIILILPGEEAEFIAMTDATTCVVKWPSVAGDKELI